MPALQGTQAQTNFPIELYDAAALSSQDITEVAASLKALGRPSRGGGGDGGKGKGKGRRLAIAAASDGSGEDSDATVTETETEDE